MQKKEPETHPPEPRGFGEHARGLAGEYAHEQGWGLNEEERIRQLPPEEQADGGANFDYGARDFGDVPTRIPDAAKPDSPRTTQPQTQADDPNQNGAA